MAVVLPLIPMTLAPLLEIVIPGPAEREIDPTLVEVPAPRADTTMPDATVVFPLIPMTLAPLDEIVMPGPAERDIVPVEEPPGAEMAFRPLTDTVMELTPV